MLKNIPKAWYLLSNSSANFNILTKRHAGHSKWANIRHIKAEKDAQRSVLFTRLTRQMKVAIQLGGSADPKKNLKLTQIIEQAKRFNMPAASIQNVLKSSELNKNQCKSYMLEIKGPGGCIILCELFTDNLHQVKQLFATVLKKHLSKFGDGGAKHLFEQKGLIETDVPYSEGKSEEAVLEVATEHAIETGAEDVKLIDNTLEFVCEPTVFQKVQHNLEKLNYKITSASVEFTPIKLQTLSDTDLEVCSSLCDKLEKFPEVVKLYDNIA